MFHFLTDSGFNRWFNLDKKEIIFKYNFKETSNIKYNLKNFL